MAPPNMDSAITQKGTGFRSGGKPSSAMYVSTCKRAYTFVELEVNE